MLKLNLTYLLLIVSIFSLNAQTFKGTVLDAQSNAPLQYVNIYSVKNRTGAVSNVEGTFAITMTVKPDWLQLSCMGYKTQKVRIDSLSTDTFYLEPTAYIIDQFSVDAQYVAVNSLIRNIIDHKTINDINQSQSYTCHVYSKTKVGIDTLLIANQDSIAKDDSVWNEIRDFTPIFTEAITVKNKVKGQNATYKKIAHKVAGLEEYEGSIPIEMVFSGGVYAKHIEVFTYKFHSPIENHATDKYNYHIDSIQVIDEHDTMYHFSFKPKKSVADRGLTGSMVVDKATWAIVNFNANGQFNIPPMDFEFNVKQSFEQKDSIWKPINTKMHLLLPEDLFAASTAQMQDTTMILGLDYAGYYYDYQFQSVPKKEEKFQEVVYETRKFTREESEVVLEQERPIQLTPKEVYSIQEVDSVGDSLNFTKFVNAAYALADNRIRIKQYIDLDLNRIITFNGYENVRLGLGAHTSEKVSKYVKLGGYFGYGFGDNAFKYGADIQLSPKPVSWTSLKLEYYKDLQFLGERSFLDSPYRLFENTESYALLFLSRMDNVEMFKATLRTKPFKYTQAWLYGMTGTRQNTSDYRYIENGEPLETYQIFEAGVQLRFSYKETFIKNSRQYKSLKARAPIFWLKLSQGFDGIWGSNIAYQRAIFSVEDYFRIPKLGLSQVKFESGWASKNAPLNYLYNIGGAYTKDGISTSVANAFITMPRNSYTATRYANLYFRHNFEGRLVKIRSWNPYLTVATNIGFGEFDGNPNIHQNANLNDYAQGYYESGIEANNLFKLERVNLFFGFGVYYHYGSYANPDWRDNFTFVLSAIPISGE